jgi:hypothetical protein
MDKVIFRIRSVNSSMPPDNSVKLRFERGAGSWVRVKLELEPVG